MTMSRKKPTQGNDLLLLVQPHLAQYRIPVLEGIAKKTPTILVYSQPKHDDGFGHPEIDKSIFTKIVKSKELNIFNIIFYQTMLLTTIHRYRPSNIIIFANPRYVSFWLTLLYGRLLRCKVFCHGHGAYNKDNSTATAILYRLQYTILISLSFRYICYNQAVKDSLVRLKIAERKLVVAENSLINDHPVRPESKTGKENGVIFIGRLRTGNALDILIQALVQINKDRQTPVKLHIIGDGPEKEKLEEIRHRLSWIKTYGELYDHDQIAQISQDCFCGCYPGNAGLSIVHFMSLSLVPIINGCAPKNGPEVAHVKNGVNGFSVTQEDTKQGIFSIISQLISNPDSLRTLRSEAFKTYTDLTDPPLSQRLLRIIRSKNWKQPRKSRS